MTEEKNEKTEEPQEGASQAGSKVDKSLLKQEGQGGDGGQNGENVESVKAGPESIKSEEKPKEQPKEQTGADLLKDDLDDIKIRRAKGSKNISSGVVHILATFNNTKVTISDQTGNVISWASAGKCGFRGSRKSTAYAAQVVTQDAGRVAMGHGLREVEVRVRGPGMGRDSAIRSLQALGLNVLSIIDVTPVPHNGCRPPKRRRV